MRIASPACWRGGAEAAMWFIAATRRRGPAGGTGNPAGGSWRVPDSRTLLGRSKKKRGPDAPRRDRRETPTTENHTPTQQLAGAGASLSGTTIRNHRVLTAAAMPPPHTTNSAAHDTPT